mgnify:CR=1 FL=1
MSVENIFIVLEGVDGSGKTTVGKALAQKMDACFCQTPMGLWRKKRAIVENKNSFFRFLFYVVATIHSSIIISRILKNDSVVCDRYIHSTLAHHVVYWNKLVGRLSPNVFPIKRPHFVFYLYSRVEIRDQRTLQRESNKPKDLDSKSLQQVHEAFLGFTEILPIDTSDISVNEVVNLIIEKLQQEKEKFL